MYKIVQKIGQESLLLIEMMLFIIPNLEKEPERAMEFSLGRICLWRFIWKIWEYKKNLYLCG